MCVLTRPKVYTLFTTPPADVICVIRSHKKTTLSPKQVDVQSKHAQNEKHFNSTKRNIKRPSRAIYYWYNNTHSSPADVKQNKRSRIYHRKIQNFTTYLPFGNDANFGNHPDAADVKIQPKSHYFLLKIKYFCNFSLVSLSIHARSRRGAERIRKAEGRGALEPPPEDFYVFHSFTPRRRQAKQTNAQALQTSRKTNKSMPPQNSKLYYRLEMMPILEIIQALQTSRYNRSLKVTSSKYNIFATSRLSRSSSVRVHVEVRNGYGRARGVGAAPRKRRSNEAI